MLISTLGVLGAMSMLVSPGDNVQTARDVRGPPPVIPIENEPPPKLIVDPPVPEWLAEGRVVIQYRADNLRIVQVFGPKAVEVSPRIGHLHVTVDEGPWRWVDASGEPLIINCLTPGEHKVLIELVNANHQVLDSQIVRFVVPNVVHPNCMR